MKSELSDKVNILGRIANNALDCFFFFSSRRRHTRLQGDWSSDVCSSDLYYQDYLVVISWPFDKKVVKFGNVKFWTLNRDISISILDRRNLQTKYRTEFPLDRKSVV